MKKPHNKKELGNIGEQHALKFLQQQGLQLIEKNFHCRLGEIDLIMRDGDYLVFVEVRSRKNQGYGNALESIGYFKQQKIKKAAQYFFCKYSKYHKMASRFDVFVINQSNDCSDPAVARQQDFCWLKNAFY